MIWAVVSREEMEGCTTSPTFEQYSSALGKDNVRLSVVDESDDLGFISHNDIVLLRTANETIISTLRKKGIVSTAEDYVTYKLANDKASLASVLQQNGILVPTQYNITDVVDGDVYFVKPRFGGDNNGISDKCVCRSKQEVIQQKRRIEDEIGGEVIIEDYIGGTECTVAGLCAHNELLSTHAIEQDTESRVWKKINGNTEAEIKNITERLCSVLSIKHHTRIDFRKARNGQLYVIDVNLIPTLGESSLFPKCLYLDGGISYINTIKAIIGSAT